MVERLATIHDRLRDPRYTGENRCLACTIVNSLIAITASLLLATISIELAVVLFALSTIAIAFRGYLVPGTPTLTKRYLPEEILQLFGTHPAAESTTDASGNDDEPEFETIKKIQRQRKESVDPETYLSEAGVIEVDQDDPNLTDEFARRSRKRIDQYSDGTITEADVADLFQSEPESVTERDADRPTYKVDNRVRNWISEGAFLIDLGTHDTLSEVTHDWFDVPMEQRLDILQWLRGLQDTCPRCGGTVEFSADLIQSCCGTWDVTTVACLDCDERLREFDPASVGSAGEYTGITP